MFPSFSLSLSMRSPSSGGRGMSPGPILGESSGRDHGVGRVRHALHSDAPCDGGGAAHAVQLHVSLVGARAREQPGARRYVLHFTNL